jgi:hypothetical protein
VSGLHQLNEVQPPWVAFPELTVAELSRQLKQGAVEAWADQHWRPFWSSLDPEDRAGYLDYWDATPDWRVAIAFVFERDPNFDAESDAAESREHLESLRAKQNVSSTSLFGRLFKRS